MSIFSSDFQSELVSGIVKIVQSAVDILVENQKEEQRYLNKTQAKKYLGGMDSNDFAELEQMGLKVIVIRRNIGSTTIRYDKKDLDEFMALNKNIAPS